MIPIAKIAEKTSAYAVKKKAGAKALHAAYKAAPGPTAMQYTKAHKFGVGLTAISFAPIHFGGRRSSHQGIDRKQQS